MMRSTLRKILPLLALTIFSQSDAHAQTKAPDDAQVLSSLRERVDIAQTHCSIVVALIEGDKVRFLSAGKTSFRPDAPDADENTVYEIGSITKAFTGILLADAVARGEVGFNDPIAKHLPTAWNLPERIGNITLLQLAVHTSGLPRLPDNLAPRDAQNPYADYSAELLQAFLSGHTLMREPGIKYEYSNLGAGLLGFILGQRARISYEALLKERVLQPLKLNDTAITLSPTQKARTATGTDLNEEAVGLWDFSVLAGAGALRSTAKDMAQFVAANWKTDALAGVLETAQQPRFNAEGQLKMGLGWHILAQPDAPIVWHNGGTGGFRSFIGFTGGQKRGVVVLSNSSQSVDDLGLHLLDARIALAPIAPKVSVDETILDEYVGQYELVPEQIFTITREGDKLWAQLTGQPRFRVFATSATDFAYRIVNAQLTFERGADGKVNALTLHQNGDKRAKKLP